MNAQLRVLSVGVALLTGFGMFWNMANQMLWNDETATALLAVNITKYGVPRAFDGKNEITLRPDLSDLSEEKLYTWSPWLGEYFAAGSFALFGKSTWAARLPFAAIALASMGFLSVVAHRLYQNREITLVAVLLLMTCVPFYLLARQCRYYGILYFAQVWMIYGFDQVMRGSARRGTVHIAFALAMQFYSNYIIIPGSVAGLLLAGCLLFREHRQLAWALPASMFGSFLLALPWLLYTPPGNQIKELVHLLNIDDNLFYCLSEIHFHLLPIPVLLIPLAVHVYRRDWSNHGLASCLPSAPDLILWSMIICQISSLSFFLPMVFFRYLAPLIPVLVLLAASIITRLVKPAWTRYVLILVLALSNVLAIASGWPIRGDHKIDLPYLTYMRSITTDYDDRLETVVRFLQRESTPEQTVFVADSELPIIFYTDMRVIDARFHPEWPAEPPDWVFPVNASSTYTPAPLPPLPQNFHDLYEPVVLSVPATPREAIRSDPHVHGYFSVSTTEEWTLYKLKAK